MPISTRTSVLSVAGSPSIGSVWVNPDAGSARRPRRLIQMPVYLDATLQLGSTDLTGVSVRAAGTKRIARLGGHGVLQGGKHYRSKRDGNSAEHTTPRLMAS